MMTFTNSKSESVTVGYACPRFFSVLGLQGGGYVPTDWSLVCWQPHSRHVYSVTRTQVMCSVRIMGLPVGVGNDTPLVKARLASVSSLKEGQ